MSQSNPETIERIRAVALAADADGAAVIGTDLHGVVVYWSDGARDLYGWSPQEVVGRNILDITPTHLSGDEAGRIMEQLRRGKSWNGDFILRRRDGKPIIASVHDTPVIDRELVIGVVGVSRAR